MKIENQLIDNRENKCVDFAEQNTKPSGTALVQTPGKKFAEIQAQTMDTINLQHKKLIQSGSEVSQDIRQFRTQLIDQLRSERYLSSNSDWIGSLRTKTASIYDDLEGIAEDLSKLEDVLSLRLEENVAMKNATFASQQQESLEQFEQELLREREERKLQILDDERRALDQVFQNDLKTYQAVRDYLGVSYSSVARSQDPGPHTLEDVDLVVSADAAQLENFYKSSESEAE